MLFERNVPLECNRVGFERAIALKKECLGLTEEAKKYQKATGMHFASVLKSGDDSDYIKEYKHIAGTIVNQSIAIYLYTESILSSMFEIVPFTGNDIPAWSITKFDQIPVTRMSTHGRAPERVVYRSTAQTFPSLYNITTDKIYQTRASILSGEVGADSEFNRRCAMAIEAKIEADVWTLIASCIGSFTVANTWVYDTLIQGLPTTNAYDFSSEGSLTLSLFKKIMAAVDVIPSLSRGGAPASIRNMFIPHTVIQGIRDWVSLVAATEADAVAANNNVTQELQRQIETGGPMIQSLWGENLGIRKINRLMGTSVANFAKYLWVFLDGPVGRLYIKTDEDYTEVLTDHGRYEQGLVISKMIGMEIPAPYRPNFMLVNFDA
jgi:hypothetical protein